MTVTETLAVVIGGFAALATLLYTMMGNPNMLDVVRRRLKNSSSPAHPPRRRVVNIEWSHLEAAAAAFAAGNTVPYDLVVGVQPDGVFLANLVANRIRTRCVAMDKHYVQSMPAPFFVFNQDKHSRSLRESQTQFTPPSDIVNPSHILVIDMVTTFGNGLLKAESKILESFSNAIIDFYVYAIDQARLAASHPEIVDRVNYRRTIDNYVEWLRFPWESM